MKRPLLQEDCRHAERPINRSGKRADRLCNRCQDRRTRAQKGQQVAKSGNPERASRIVGWWRSCSSRHRSLPIAALQPTHGAEHEFWEKNDKSSPTAANPTIGFPPAAAHRRKRSKEFGQGFISRKFDTVPTQALFWLEWRRDLSSTE